MSTYVEFLQSDMIELCASGSTCSFKIHQKLLQTKCMAASGAFRHKFPEAESKRYAFTETADLTISQFVEWAYRGDYDEPDSSAVEKCRGQQQKHKQEVEKPCQGIADGEGVPMYLSYVTLPSPSIRFCGHLLGIWSIICGNETFLAHRFVVCPRSAYFASACSGRFKDGNIHLEEATSFLIEKMLEFLYTGNYTFRRRMGAAMSAEPNGGEEEERSYAEPTREVGTNQPSEDHEVQFPAEDELSVIAPGHTTKGLTHGSLLDGNIPVISNNTEDSLIEQRHTPESASDEWAAYHPCYLHMRMYGAADYFMIHDLKIKAKVRFSTAFTDFPDRKSFAEMIKELYSSRANYVELRDLAIKLIVDNLPELGKGLIPVIDSNLLSLIPDFASDLCLSTIDKYVNAPPNMKPYSFATGIEFGGVIYKRDGI